MLRFYNKNFEKEVRHELLIYDRPISKTDALLAYDLDLDGFTFSVEDCETLCAFKNIDWLRIKTDFSDFPFLQGLEKLEKVSVEYVGKEFDCACLSSLKALRYLTVFCENSPRCKIVNVEELAKLPHLEVLTLHHIETVNLQFLEKMHSLKSLELADIQNIKNVDSIARLRDLSIIDSKLENLDFLNFLDDDTLLIIHSTCVTEAVDVSAFNRFEKYDLDFIACGKKIEASKGLE